MTLSRKPICGKWHGNDVMPKELENCIFALKTETNWSNQYVVGFREGCIIHNMRGEEICNEASVEHWCYIDLNY